MRPSNTFYLLLLLGCFGILAVYLYMNRDAMGIDLVFMPFAVVVISIPFAIVLCIFISRFISEGVIGGLFGGRSYPDIKKYSSARALLAEDKFEEAIEGFRKLLDESPEDYYCQEQVGSIYAEKLKDYPKAVEEYHKLLEMKIDETVAVNTLNRLAYLYSDHLNDHRSAAKSLSSYFRTRSMPNARKFVSKP